MRHSSAFQHYGPPLLLLILLVVIGFGIHRKSAVTAIPPTHDSFHYYLKSKGVWEQLRHGAILNTLNVAEPVMRPPGGVLVSYPFGFSKDYRGFFFRNAFMPIVIFASALWLLALHFTVPGRQRWMASAFIGGFSSFSMFYHFTFNPEIDGRWEFYHPWGMQDCLLASAGVLATVLLTLSARKRSLLLSILGAVVGSWMLLIKPAGALLMVLVFWLWIAEVLILHWPLRRAWCNDRGLRQYIVSTSVIIGILFSATVILSVSTKYLSAETRSLFTSGLKLVLDFTHPLSPGLMNQLVLPSLGWHWFVFLVVAIAVLAVTHFRDAVKGCATPENWRLPAVLVGFSGGLYWWICTAGQQVRYLFPFLLILVAGILPDLLLLTRRFRLWSCWVLGLGSLVPTILVTGLVFAKHPSLELQRAIGVSVTTDGLKEDAAIASHVMADARARQTLTCGYLLTDDASFAVIHSITELERSLEPDKPFVAWYASWDWQRGFLVSRAELLRSSYVLFRRATANADAILKQEDLTTWTSEAAFFKVWLEQLGEQDGVRLVMRDKLCLLEIVDWLKFDHAFESMMAGRKWRDAFIAENALKPTSPPVQLFGASRETLFHLSPTEDFGGLRARGGFTLSREPGRIVVQASDNDGALEFPRIEVPADRRLIVRVCGESPVPCAMEIRYGLEKQDGPATMRAVAQVMSAGRNELYFLLPCEAGRTLITLHLPPWAGRVSLSEIEVRAIPND